MMRVGSLLSGCALLLLLISQRASAVEELSWGVEPFMPARHLANAFKLPRDFLGERTDSRIVITTTANYDQFVQALQRGEYDMALVGPHSGALAMQKAGYQQLVQCEGSLKALLLVDRNSSYRKPQDLKGQVIALPDHLTVTSMLGTEFFRPPFAGQPVEVNFRYNDFQNMGPLMTLRGEAAAAVIADSALAMISPQIRDDLRVIAESKPVPQMMVLVHGRVPAEKRARLREASLEFLRSPQSRANPFVQGCPYGEKPLSGEGLRQITPYAEELKRRLSR